MRYQHHNEPTSCHPSGEFKNPHLRVDFDRRLKLAFHGSRITSDGGLLAYRELDDALGLSEVAGGIFQDSRTGKNGRHGNEVRRRLLALAYNLGNFMRTLALPKEVEHWSLTTLREKLVKIGAKVVRHGRYVAFQMAEVAVPRMLFAEILRLIARLRPPPDSAPEGGVRLSCVATKATGEVRLDCDQSDPSALSRRPLAHGEGFLGGSWAESIANNAEIAQSVVWLPVHMGNVGEYVVRT